MADRTNNDELPITQARADDAAQPDNAAATRGGGQQRFVKRREYLARRAIASPATRLTKARPFAGGLPINTPFGHDREHRHHARPGYGIGQWSDPIFLRRCMKASAERRTALSSLPYAEYTRSPTGRAGQSRDN